ncbi:ImmA/IrrE family metallo-endopeptidase [Ruminococcus sp. Marseille-P6503]|uniref:ImmA/IrrE family metallo-endopeptidase n=1 Tax=Ruminococcus sp. Marseille-P6503 TaxID=2364796 RepID=UPI000F54387C|nr:ImmA/IrrE family metallo-endopeptidase [Ruminococcus sp. Marseille-P6503]
MTSAELYRFADGRNILTIDGRLNKARSLSLMDGARNCAIVMDSSKISTSAEETVILAHEVGHCETGAFYDENSLELRSRCEYRADKWAIKMLIPKESLAEALENGATELWQLAEYFGVTEDFMLKACRLYGLIT